MSKVDDARRDAEDARARLQGRFGLFRERTTPKALISNATGAAKKRVFQAGIAALSNARTRPIVAAGIAATAIAYLFRKPILKALRKRAGEGDTHEQ
jgi:hypothetical protein